MDYQFMEINSEIVVELTKGNITARRVNAHSTRVIVDDGLENYIRVFTNKNRVMIKAIANISPDIELLVPEGVKSIKIIGDDFDTALYGFGLDRFECETKGDVSMHQMEIRKVCNINSDGGDVAIMNSFVRGLNLRSTCGTFETFMTRLRGNNTIYLDQCEAECALVGEPEEYTIVARSGMAPEQVMMNGQPITDANANKDGMDWIMVAGGTDNKHRINFIIKPQAEETTSPNRVQTPDAE